jgi:hypothetical protein
MEIDQKECFSWGFEFALLSIVKTYSQWTSKGLRNCGDFFWDAQIFRLKFGGGESGGYKHTHSLYPLFKLVLIVVVWSHLDCLHFKCLSWIYAKFYLIKKRSKQINIIRVSFFHFWIWKMWWFFLANEGHCWRCSSSIKSIM